jgi:peroxiredoxin
MARSDDVNILPDGLPVPMDDGACDHLVGMVLPTLELRATSGRMVDLSKIHGRTVVYIYPRTGRPDQEPPDGWNEIPGARGCTPQSCSFRDHKIELERLGAQIFGLSTQDSAYQLEAVERLHLPFELLSDQNLALAKALNLPTFSADGLLLIKRVTVVLKDGKVEKVCYPVFPPDRNAEKVISWLRDNPAED